MQNISQIHSKSILHIQKRMKGFYADDIVDAWAKDVIINFNNLFLKYNITNFEINKNSYMGIVLDCLDANGENIIIKNVPNFLNRFEAEISTILKLPNNVRCSIFEYDVNSCMIVMERVKPGNSAHFFQNQEEYKHLFDILSANKIEIDNKIPSKTFWQVVESDYKKYLSLPIKKDPKEFETVKKYYEVFLNTRSLFENETNFLLHGDIHRNNALVANDGIKLVDPLGFTAPFVFEFGALCAYELYDANQNNFEEIFAQFCKFVSIYEDLKKFQIALKDVVIKIFIPSLYEACDNNKKSKKLLQVLKFLDNIN